MDQPFSLEGRSILVTGATSGIGRETALECARAGARVALVARSVDSLNEVASAMPGTGHLVAPFDLSKTGETADFVVGVGRELGGLHGLVHAAGLHRATPLRSLRPDEMELLYAVNVVAAAMLVKGMRHKSVRQPGASAVLLSSAVGLVGQAGVASYSASKGAIVTLTKSLALEVAREGVRVNCICPGVVETPMTAGLRAQIGEDGFRVVADAHPFGVGTPHDVAMAARFLLSDAARWVTGASLSVDGGYTAQ